MNFVWDTFASISSSRCRIFSFPGLDQFPNLVFNDLNGLPVGPDSVAPQYTVQNMYQVTDNLSWTKGKHTFKFGFDGRKFISPQTFTQRRPRRL